MKRPIYVTGATLEPTEEKDPTETEEEKSQRISPTTRKAVMWLKCK